MIKAYVIRRNFPTDLIGEREFLTLPAIGTSILVSDKNSNTHALKVVGIRQVGVDAESEVANFLKSRCDSFGIQLICDVDLDWEREKHQND